LKQLGSLVDLLGVVVICGLVLGMLLMIGVPADTHRQVQLHGSLAGHTAEAGVYLPIAGLLLVLLLHKTLKPKSWFMLGIDKLLLLLILGALGYVILNTPIN